jgi:ethanolamine utilization protein EutQ (cupin superfamily)
LCFGLTLSSCSTWEGTQSNTIQSSEQRSTKLPSFDVSKADWKKMAPSQPDEIKLRAAVIARESKIGATRVAIKVAPGSAVPPHWYQVKGAYTVLKGTFVFDEVDAEGRPVKTRKRPGDFSSIPANYIIRMAVEGNEEGLLYLTMYGDWAPQFQSNPWNKPTLRNAR